MCGEGREGVRYWGVTERAIHTWVGVHGSSNRSYVEIQSLTDRDLFLSTS